VTFVAVLAMVNHGCSRGGVLEGDDRDDSLSFDLNDPQIRDRLGEDDGYAFAVLYGGDVHGSLETCG
jgi:hypothetical protein